MNKTLWDMIDELEENLRLFETSTMSKMTFIKKMKELEKYLTKLAKK